MTRLGGLRQQCRRGERARVQPLTRVVALLAAVAALSWLAPTFIPGMGGSHLQVSARRSAGALRHRAPLVPRAATVLMSLKLAELKAQCKDKGLGVTGKKKELVARLEAAMAAAAAEVEEEFEPVAAEAMAEPAFQVGQKVEGYYQEDEEW